MKISFFFFCLSIGDAFCLIHKPGVFIKIPRYKSFFCEESFNAGPSSLKYAASDPPAVNFPPPLKILLLVEPSPFTYVSGYSNRFRETLKYLRDDVRIITAEKDPDSAPTNFSGFPIYNLRGFDLPIYKQVTLSFDWEGKVGEAISHFQPDLVHVSVPSALVFSAVRWSKKFNVPLLMSYHTDLVEYSRSYLPFPLLSSAFAKFLVRNVLKQADLVLTTSPQLQDKLEDLGIENAHVWRKGINTKVKHYLGFYSFYTAV
jgi:sulfoquinovosyltransferase